MGRIIYVVKDQNDNFVNQNCFVKYEGKFLYISYINFSRECRGYLSKDRADEVLRVLKSKSDGLGLDYVFKVIEVNLSDEIGLYKDALSLGIENMIVVEIGCE